MEAEADTLVLLSSSLMPVLLESRQIASGLTDFTSFNTVDADDDDTCFVTSPGEMDSYDPAVEKVKRKEDTKYGSSDQGLVITLYVYHGLMYSLR